MKTTKTTFLSERCTEEGHGKYQFMRMADGTVLCPKCEVERRNNELEESNKDLLERIDNRKKHAYLSQKSILSDMTLKDAGFKNYMATKEEEVKNKRYMNMVVKRYLNGEVFNTWLMGDPGVGKSHLSMAALKNINGYKNKDKKCLYISISAMLRKIRAGFSKESIYTEDYFINLMGEVDFLVLDDIGSETGSIGTDKRASDFVHRVLYDLGEIRQGKPTIITTNASWEELEDMYDEKVISRLSSKIETITFTNTSDKRLVAWEESK
ncbi:MAG: ATP-binding protein [Carnobacterium sp.]|uniref:ATP-binding protein n=1 Tax=Carnobacterium sp. TaxID=48221 RepID=UPI003C746B16